MSNEGRFTKIGPSGEKLAADAAAWDAVLDTATGLTWSVKEPKSMPWKKAIEWAKKLKVSGFADWRLPTVEELFLLADRTKADPAIDQTYFPDCKSEWYWSSTPYARSPGVFAWYVSFNNGYSFWYGQVNDLCVRAVRSSQ